MSVEDAVPRLGEPDPKLAADLGADRMLRRRGGVVLVVQILLDVVVDRRGRQREHRIKQMTEVNDTRITLTIKGARAVGASAKRSAQPDRFSHWPKQTLDCIDGAILAISVITLAEARYGYLNAGWGAARVEREERRLASFLQIPLDLTIADEWARLIRDHCRDVSDFARHHGECPVAEVGASLGEHDQGRTVFA